MELDKIGDWLTLSVNKLSINVTKTKFFPFRSRNKSPIQNINISINNENMKIQKNVTFLGIVIDEFFFTWGNHLNLIKKKLIKCAAIISRIRHFTTPNASTYLLRISLSTSDLW